MTTFTYDAVRVDFNFETPVFAQDGVELKISAPPNGGFTYRVREREDGETPLIKVTENDAFSITVNGQDVLRVADARLGVITWSGKQTTILTFEIETSQDRFTDYFVVISGAPLPPINNVQQFNNFNNRITDVSGATGAFGPGREIKFKSLDFTSRDANDIFIGNGTDQEFKGLGGDDTMNGKGGNDTLIGGPGDDEFFNEAGSDKFNGGRDFDEVDYSDAKRAIDANWKTKTIKDGFNQIDKFFDIELVRGSQFDDTFQGNGQANQIRGLAGDDTINGAGGIDTARYDKDAEDGGTAGVTVDLKAETATDGFGDTDTLLKIENVIGTAKRDIIEGDEQNNRIRGEGGNDRIVGDEGNDTLLGEGGRDNLLGGEGRDTLNGGDGNDNVNGGSGADLIIGGRGRDILIGGDNNDRFVFNGKKFGKDTIKDFDATSSGEKIDLRGVSSIKGFGDLKANHMTRDGQDVIIDDGIGNTITLEDVRLADLGADDFIF
ncbi:MAG: calcium-binding protein [Pseudomonadota bacterium]